jgi:hypothetical protein
MMALSGVTGRAGTLWDVDLLLNPKYLSDKTTYSSEFDITSKYNPTFETVTYAYAWFPVTDDQWFDWSEEVAVDLGGQPFLGPSSATLNVLGGNVSGNAFATLDTTGQLKYSFRGTEGDSLSWGGKLYVETRPRSVPDGGATLMLLGMALGGIEPLRRKMSRRNTEPRRA